MLRLIPSWLSVLAGETNLTRSPGLSLCAFHGRWVDSELAPQLRDGTGIEAAVGARDGQVLSNAVAFINRGAGFRTCPRESSARARGGDFFVPKLGCITSSVWAIPGGIRMADLPNPASWR